MRYHIARAQVWTMGEIKTKQGQLITALFFARAWPVRQSSYIKKLKAARARKLEHKKKYNKVARSQVISCLADWARKIN